MFFSRWLRNRISSRGPLGRAPHRAAAPRFRPRLEALEDRWLPSTLTVANPLDVVDPNDGLLSLREAIQQADPATPGGDTIIFDNSLNGRTITLSGGELFINKNLNIQGPGAAQVAISGNHLSRVFEVAYNVQVTLADLTIRDGKFTAGINTNTGGGGIFNAGTLTVSGCTLSGNSSEKGGGIYHGGRLLTVTSCTFSGNVASSGGGGIFNQGIATVSDSTLSGNSAPYGGGISNASTLTLSGCTLSGNSASNRGGGIYNSIRLTVSSCTLSGNSAGVAGGGISNHDTLTLSNSTLVGNSASNGGGIYSAPFSGSSLTVSGCTLSGNSADIGGAIYNAYVFKSSLTIRDSALSGNSANIKGGGLYNNGAAIIERTTVSSNSAAVQGGGIFNDSTGTLTLSASTVTGNFAPVGADLYNLGKLSNKKSVVGVTDP